MGFQRVANGFKNAMQAILFLRLENSKRDILSVLKPFQNEKQQYIKKKNFFFFFNRFVTL